KASLLGDGRKPSFVPLLGGGGFLVRPAWAHSWECKSSREQATASEMKRNCGRVTDRGEEA
ncbi:hypothetical protein, partial [Marinobacter sp.]|uniref:hypothetical protein n=1 Tax=Marinobacter sp. TaxID=50741 RepID=UPI003297887D